MIGHHKRCIALRCWLLSRSFSLALEAMDFAERLHTGVRKDGTTPEFDHQVSITHYLRGLPGLSDPETTLAVAMLHDVREDHGVEDAELRIRFGSQIADAVAAMTKEFRGVREADDLVFARISASPVASIVKPADRVHNQATMHGVFSVEKQKAYIAETRAYCLPSITTARRRFPGQELAYARVRNELVGQIAEVEAFHDAAA